MVCIHVETHPLTPPTAFDQVHKEECTQCFDNQDGPEGIDVCLTCFNGGCLDSKRHHALTHSQLSGHPLAVNIRRRVINNNKRDNEQPPPPKITKIVISPENEEPQYEYLTKIHCYICNQYEQRDATPKLNDQVEAILNSMSSAKQSEVKAWEEVITPCEHTLCLQQEPPKKLEGQALAHCANCDLNQNLWLCLICGNLGCGRKQYDGSGGNNHAIEHFEKTGHGVNVKLGTITPEGTADIYCYSCDDARIDENLASHLANWGINVAQQLKTEKSMTELQLEQNLKFDFSMTTEDGKQLEPRFGPGFTGLKNLGNSCYMASVLQSVFHLSKFRYRYDNELRDHALTCTQESSANCWYCQLHKIADGLLSGRYSHYVQQFDKDHGVESSDGGVAPSMFKTLVGKNHPEFSTMRQQDAFEFFQYFCKTVQQKEHATKSNDPTNVFEFETEQRLQCDKCKRVRYQKDKTSSISVSVPVRQLESGGYENVDFYECLNDFVKEEIVDGYQCPQCKEKTIARRSVKFSTFPEILVLNPRRFTFIDWVPQKLDIKIDFPEGPIQLDKYLSKGQQDGEELLPEEEEKPSELAFNENDIEQLKAMGFSENRCKRALINTGNQGAEIAMNWIFEHMDDADVDDPLPSTSTSAGGVSQEQIHTLQEMGFTEAQAKKALRETNNDTERALDWLFSHPDDSGEDNTIAETNTAGDAIPPFNYEIDSFISHKGTSVHCGHYVSHIHHDGEWVLFNDNKVAVTPNPPIGDAYLYFLKRLQ
ncbi:uncharacterized protein BX663DRAFT_505550 [Cokeromyces recurvatus]|uniref:uncharacterized protein n=1 Tax=Cokeromyces recurvatus TaxID=90255 RepID=UPI0022201960|nr:uncharacterized protein BX663DRAFT_505550 [Cokeromyces recurvatus]KAI7903879.1 hypothetical protein BX663DRAFT_505550 [Cokeromyces recurvatus]